MQSNYSEETSIITVVSKILFHLIDFKLFLYSIAIGIYVLNSKFKK